MPRKVFVAGEILTASDVNTNLMDQSVMVFDDATDRATAIPTPVEGMVTYLKDTDRLEQFDGTNFVVAAPPQTGVLQVKQTVLTSVFAEAGIASGAFSAEISGLQVSITPASASNKILVSCQVSGQIAGGGSMVVQLQRDGNPIGIGDASDSRPRVTSVSISELADAGVMDTGTTQFLDTPATTSSVTYGLKLFNNIASSGTLHINRNTTDPDGRVGQRTISTITAMEVTP